MTGSKDEEEKEWNFQEMDAVLNEIATKNAGIGGILAAMVYQIEHNNKAKNAGSKSHPPTERMTVGGGNNRVDDKSNPQGATDQTKEMLTGYFDDLFNKLTIAHNVKETAFKHQFNEVTKINPKGSPYQGIFNESDRLS